MIDRVTIDGAYDRLVGHGLVPIGLGWAGDMSVSNGTRQAVVCDYRRLPGYEVALAIAVYDRDGGLLERLNVMRVGGGL